MRFRTPSATKCVSQFFPVLALALFVFSAFAQPAAKKYLVLFPFGLSNDVMETQGYKLQEELTKSVRAALDSDKTFAATVFTRSHPAIKRGLSEGTLKSAILLEPFIGMSDGQHKAITLGKLVRAEIAAAGVVEDFSFDAEKKKAKLTASIQLFDVKAAKIIGSVVLTSEGTGATEPEAAKDAASKFARAAVPQVVATFNQPKKDK